ncbi:MAG TPA: lipoyl synthase [Acidimicrobiales bacterium]|nr:lipoyl synthase [Acidimicrobiales bacterium]
MLRVRHLGRVRYREALALQRALAERATDDYLLLLEHPHVYTLGVRADPAHVLVDPASVGAEKVAVDRGGDVTYHGPGQLVVYPVVTVDDDPAAGKDHVRRLEQVVIDALYDLGVGERVGGVGRLPGHPGIWLGTGSDHPRKVGAVGVRTVRANGRRRTLHGLALNVTCDLTMFDHIVPCGIRDLPVTSLTAEGFSGSVEEVAAAVVGRAVATWGSDGFEEQAVTGAGRQVQEAGSQVKGIPPAPGPERAQLRRLRQAGVDPAAGLPLRSRKPEWLRVPARMGEGYLQLGRTVHDLGLVTVCEEAGCPNIYECWADGTATFMVNGARCTRACGFCLVDTRQPLPLDPDEPMRVAEAVARMGLAHAVITCVARDDLPDGGAGAIAATVEAVRLRCPGTAVEVLISDCKGEESALGRIFDVRPDVLNHNIETVARLQRAVRPSAGYARSLSVLARAAAAGLVVKSGLMVGLGEREDEVVATLADLSSVGVSIATVGQYLRPSADHLPVSRWWTPAELDGLARAGRALGLAHVEASPLTRSSYHARRAASRAGVSGVAGSGAPGRAVSGRAEPAQAVPVRFTRTATRVS